MKKSCNVPLLALTVILLFAGCTKKDDVTSTGSLSQTVSNEANTIPELSTCKIRRIYQDFNGERVSALFSYTRAGNPYSVIYSNGGTGVDDHFFTYDSQNRLTEWRQTWGGFAVKHHFFKYNAQNQILKDSTLHYNPGNGELHSIYVSTIEYDAQGRVIKETIVNTFNRSGTLDVTRRPTYTYDSRGNLAVAGWKSSSYDFKINPLRQNAIFQFILRNYSTNNAAPQPKYNSLGLPLSINPANDLLFNNLITYQVVYDCQ